MKKKYIYYFNNIDEELAKKICYVLTQCVFRIKISNNTVWIIEHLNRWEPMLESNNKEDIDTVIEEMNNNADRIIRLIFKAKINKI